MPADRHILAEAARRRAREARKRPKSALRGLDREGLPVTFVAVAAAAGVSRTLLYRDPDLRAEVQRLRTIHSTPTQLPAAQRATDASLKQRIETLLDDVRTLRAENRKLRDKIAALFGEQRAATSTKHA